MKNKLCALLLALLLVGSAVLTCACNGVTLYTVPSDADATVAAIRRESKNNVNTILSDATFQLNGVSEFQVDETDAHAVLNETSSSHVVNEKFELDIDATTTGNKYDPNEVNLYGQFVSPSGDLYEMPGFWYQSCDRYLDEIDEEGEYPLKGYTVSGVTATGVLDEKEGVKKPVAKLTFSATGTESQYIGIGMDKSAVSVRQGETIRHILSVYMRKDEGYNGADLYLRLYSSSQANDTFYKIDGNRLTTAWQKFSFVYEEGIYSKQAVEDFLNNYSLFIATSGLEENGGARVYSAAVGTVYVSDAAFENHIVTGEEDRVIGSATLVDFIAPALSRYVYGDVNGTERLTISDRGTYKIRFRFTETGEWTYRVVLEKAHVKVATYTSSVTVTENADKEKNRGIIVVEPTLKRNFMFQDGTPYVPVGENVVYSVDPVRGSYDYESYFPKMAAAGMNFSRTWLTYIGYGVDSTEGGVLNFDSRQDKVYCFDHILDLATQYGLYLQVPLIHTGWLRKDTATMSGKWDSCPFNKLNGGYLDEPFEFFTDQRAKEDTKKMFRYYVARFGYSRNIMNWELFNEIGLVADYDGEAAKAWADEIGNYVHSVDPYRHLVSMSSGNDYSDVCYTSEELDFTSIHSYIYGNQYTQKSASETTRIYKWLNKPCMIGEIGASGASEKVNFAMDPEYQILRQCAFVPFGGAAGGSMIFWWQYLDKGNFYSNVTPAVELYKLLPDKFITMPSVVAGSAVRTEENVVVTSKQSLAVYGFIDSTSAYVYVMDNRYSYANITPPSNADTVLQLQNMTDGAYGIRLFDTKKGEVYQTLSATAANGILTVQLPEWSADIALLIEKS